MNDDRVFERIQRKKMSLDEVSHRLEKLRAELLSHRKPKVTREKELIYELDGTYTVLVTADIYSLLFDDESIAAFDDIDVEVVPGKGKIFLAKLIY